MRALDLKYHEVLISEFNGRCQKVGIISLHATELCFKVVDLKKVMMNPATSADYAERVRRALEDAVVDSNMKNSQYDTVASEHLPRNAINNADNNNHMASISNRVGKTWAGLAQSDLYSPFGKRSARAAGGSPTPDLMGGPHVFFGTPLVSWGCYSMSVACIFVWFSQFVLICTNYSDSTSFTRGFGQFMGSGESYYSTKGGIRTRSAGLLTQTHEVTSVRSSNGVRLG